jgi:hypothetical protein
MPIANRYYEAVSGWSASRMETIADSQAFYPITEHVRQVDAHGRYTAGAGHALYTARSFPKSYWNKVAFVAEPTGHLIGRFRLEARGSDFVSVNERTFLASDDEWCAPNKAEVGPPGALWVKATPTTRRSATSDTGASIASRGRTHPPRRKWISRRPAPRNFSQRSAATTCFGACMPSASWSSGPSATSSPPCSRSFATLPSMRPA